MLKELLLYKLKLHGKSYNLKDSDYIIVGKTIVDNGDFEIDNLIENLED